MVTAAELTELAAATPPLKGWDFSDLDVQETPHWCFEDVVHSFLDASFSVLDLGTGGGEVFAGFSPHIHRGLGIDGSESRLEAALTQDAPNLSWALMSNTGLATRDACFDLVLAKHTDYDPAEVVRVLRPGGYFITQQMGDNDTASIFETFGWGSFGDYWRRRFSAEGRIFRPTIETGQIFQTMGCAVVDYREFDVPMYFKDLRSLVHFLKSSPLPDLFDPDTHWPAVSRLVDAHSTELGIETNTHRELLIIRKP